MIRLEIFEKLPIGGKVYLGFGVTTILFAVVIWLFYTTLSQALSDQDRLLTIQEPTKSSLLHIHQHLLDARRSEKDFLATREEKFARRVLDRLDRVLDEAAFLDDLISGNADRQRTTRFIREQTNDYRNAFGDVVAAWRTKGLDHNSGLQGRFRETIHEFEDKARNYNVGSLHRLLLEIRRAEKDTGLRRRSRYVDRTLQLIDTFIGQVTDSELENEIKGELIRAVRSYRQHYATFADGVLAGNPLEGGMGAFRDSAHVIENILVSHFVPDLEKNILLLRRWEKDYLLRNDEEYVNRVHGVLGTIRIRIAASDIPNNKKTALVALLVKYEKDFLALVAQNVRIAKLEARVVRDVKQIESLIETSVDEAIADMRRASEETQVYSAQQARIAFGIALAALVLTLIFAEFITRRIATPLHTLMALTEMFSDNPRDEGDDRDEINALARSLGIMSRNIVSLFDDMKHTERELGGIASEMAEVSSSFEQDGEAGRVPEAIKRLGAAARATSELAARLRERVDALEAKLAAQAKTFGRFRSPSE